MLLSELIKVLQQHKKTLGDVEVVYSRYSDYGVLDADEINVVEAVPVPGAAGEWRMRMWAGRSGVPVRSQKCVHF